MGDDRGLNWMLVLDNGELTPRRIDIGLWVEQSKHWISAEAWTPECGLSEPSADCLLQMYNIVFPGDTHEMLKPGILCDPDYDNVAVLMHLIRDHEKAGIPWVP